MCDEHLALFCRSFICPLTERSRLFMSIQLMFRVLCSEHMGKTNLTILAAVADPPSVWPPQPTASNYILLAVEIFPACRKCESVIAVLSCHQDGIRGWWSRFRKSVCRHKWHNSTFPNCPDVATEFFKPQRTSTRKPQKSIDEKLQEHIDVADEYLLRAQGGVTVGTRSLFKLSFHFSQVGWYNSLTDTFD